MAENDFDVIVVGSGIAGLSASIAAREAGASVMLVEADTVLGGASRFSTGVVYAAGTSIQQAAGIEDNADALYRYLMTYNQFAVNPALVRYYADNAADAVEWLIGLGVEFPEEMLIQSCMSGVRRGHTPVSFCMTSIDALTNRAGVVGVETALGTRVDGLIHEDGVIRGIRADGTELRSGAVVVATGGFGNNPEMIRRFFPSAAYHGDKVWAIHRDAPFILGDGIKLGESVGAEITGFDHGLIMPSACFDTKTMEAYLPPWVVAVNREGKRFVAEWESYCLVGYQIDAQTDRRCWAIFDHEALVRNGDDIRYTDAYKTSHVISSWEERTILQQVAKGVVHRAETLDALARMAGVDPLGLAETVRVYNADVADGGCDHQFFKDGNGRPLPGVLEPPYYAVEVRPAIIGYTAAGLDIDTHSRVRDKHGRPIPGLYAAGETVGAFHGKRYAAGGLNVGGGVVFGRTAGRGAAQLAKGIGA